MENLLAGAEMLARWDVMLALLIGSVGGVIVGAIPGVGPAVAIAILLPATFSLDPIVGLTMLIELTFLQGRAKLERFGNAHAVLTY